MKTNHTGYGKITAILQNKTAKQLNRLVKVKPKGKIILNAICTTKAVLPFECIITKKSTSLGVYSEILCRFYNHKTKTNGNIWRNKKATVLQHHEKLVATVSHEMRAPLNTIIGMLQILTEDNNLNDEQLNYVRHCQHASQNLLWLANDLLDNATVKNDGFHIKTETFVLKELLEKSLAMIMLPAKEKKLQLQTNFDVCYYNTYLGYPKRLQQVIVNLLTNAVKFTESGFVSLSVVNIKPATNDHLIRITVQDSGIGIPAELQHKIFNPFQRAHPLASVDGYGLGLTIVKELVAQMNGQIWLESAPSTGTTFTIEIPLKLTQTVAQKLHLVDSHDSQKAEPKTTMPALKVMVVDDSYDNCAIIKFYLRDTPLSISCYNNAVDALIYYQTNAVDLILMDIELPDVDGITAIKAIRFWENKNLLAEIPIIAISGHSGQFIQKKLLQAGCNDWLLKPIKKEQLLQCITKNAKSLVLNEATTDYANINKSSLSHLIPQFLDNRKTDLVELETALAHFDLNLIARIGHRLKGDCGPYGFLFLERKGAELEAAAKHQDLAGTKSIITQIQLYLKECSKRCQVPKAGCNVSLQKF
jgi:CheY-like chemotaxis protein/nitrogen-specific signal transduction histidine kinase